MSYIRETCQNITQLLFLPLLKLLVLLVASRAGGDLKAIRRQPHLIVSNHVRGIDPFIICGLLSFREFYKLGPFNFMTKNVFYTTFRPFTWLLGCFPARKPLNGSDLYGVDGSIRLLDRGCSVMVFPQGKCIKPGMADVPAHSGVTRIHHARPEVPMLLCHLEYQGLKGILKRRVFTVAFRHVPKPAYAQAQEVMDEVFGI